MDGVDGLTAGDPARQAERWGRCANCQPVLRSEAAASAVRRARPWQVATLAPALYRDGLSADLAETDGQAASQRREGVAQTLRLRACGASAMAAAPPVPSLGPSPVS
jgi:hypothetical protein